MTAGVDTLLERWHRTGLGGSELLDLVEAMESEIHGLRAALGKCPLRNAPCARARRKLEEAART